MLRMEMDNRVAASTLHLQLEGLHDAVCRVRCRRGYYWRVARRRREWLEHRRLREHRRSTVHQRDSRARCGRLAGRRLTRLGTFDERLGHHGTHSGLRMLDGLTTLSVAIRLSIAVRSEERRVGKECRTRWS